MTPRPDDICPGALAPTPPAPPARPGRCHCDQDGCAQHLDPDWPEAALKLLAQSGDPAARWALAMLESGQAFLSTADPDAYTFTIRPLGGPCLVCKGDGEITEYPPDDDERMVCCPACGGTGEALT